LRFNLLIENYNFLSRKGVQSRAGENEPEEERSSDLKHGKERLLTK